MVLCGGKYYGLGPREHIPQEQVEQMVALEMNGDGCDLGFRLMTTRIRDKYKVCVTRDSVSAAQRKLDPDGVENRKKRKLSRRIYWVPGPNYL